MYVMVGISKIQANIQAIHNQYRRQNLFIATRIQDLKLELNGIEKQHRNLFQDMNKKSFKSCKVIDSNYEQVASQRCISNCDNIKSSHKLISFQKISDQNNNLKFQKKQSKIKQNSEESEMKSIKNIISQTSINRMSSFKAVKQIDKRFKRKISKNRTQFKRKSSDFLTSNSTSLKVMESSLKLGVINEKTENQKQLSQRISNKQIKCNNQVSWNTSANQQFEVSYQQEDPKMPNDLDQVLVSQKQLNMIFTCICNIVEKIKSNQSSQQPQSIENLFKVEIYDQKFKEVMEKIQENRAYGEQLQKKLGQVFEVVRKQVGVFSQKMSSEVFRIKEQLQKNRKYIMQNTANKLQTRQALKIVENRLKAQIIDLSNGKMPQNVEGLMISKCIGCNRVVNIGDDINAKVIQSYKQIKSFHKKKYSVSELKKKTMQVLKNEKTHKPRDLSKTSYIPK